MWSSAIPLVLAVTAVFFVPGLLVTLAGGLRFPVNVALAPAVSVAVVAGSGVLAPVLGLRWGVATVCVSAVALAAVVVVLRLLLGLAGRGGRRERPRDSAATAVVPGRDAAVPWAGSRGVALFLGAWAVAAVLAAYEVARVLNSPDSISQTFDAVFHLNAVRWILETGNADTLHFLVEAPKGGSLYPLGWHTSVALAMELIGSTDVPTAANAASLVVAGLIWTSGCLALSWRLFRARPAALAVTAVAAASFPAFPIVLVTFGVLYSNYLAVALLPAMLAGLIDLFPAHDEPRPPRLMLLIMVVAVGGLGLAQPNAVITFVLATALFLGVWLLRSITGFRHGGPRGQVAVRALTTVVALGVAYWLWVVLRPVRAAATWGATASTAQAVGEATLTAPGTTPVMWVPATLVIIGFAAAIKRHRLTWLATLHLITCFLYVAARSAGDASTRYSLVGTWYADVNRLSGLLPLTAVPLLTLGALVVLERASALVGRLRRPGRVLRGALAAGLCVWLLAAGVLSASMSKEVRHVESSYEFEPDSASLSDDEIALIRELPRYVPENAVIAVDPRSGAALAYAVTGIDTDIKHLFFRQSPDVIEINRSLDEAATDPAVCDAVRSLSVTYALSFPGPTILNIPPFSGFADLSTAPGFELVAKQGDAALYKITACG